MRNTGLLYRSFYKKAKQKLWKVLGVKLHKERNAFIVDLLNELNEKLKINFGASKYHALDIGYGEGDLTERISRTYNLEIIGLDLGKRFSFESRVTSLVADACSLPLKPESSHLVFAFSLIEHILEERRRRFYDEVMRVLTNDGFFVVQLPNRYFLVEQHTFIPFLGFFPSRLHRIFFHDYVSTPSKDKIVDELIKSEFRIVRTLGYGVPFSSFLRKSMLSKIFPFGFLIVARKIR